MIRQIGTWKPRWGVIATMFALVVGVATITDAQQPSKSGNIVINGVEYAPVEKESRPERQEKQLTDQPQLKPEWAAVLGDYFGWEGDDRIGMTIKQTEKKVPVGETLQSTLEFPEGSHVLLPYFQVIIYDDGLPGQGWEEDDDVYYGKLTAVEGDTLTIEIEKYLDDNEQEKPVPKALQTLTAKITQDGENTMLKIPKNREWDAVQMTKIIRVVTNTPVEPEEFKVIPQELPGKYLGTEGDDRIGMIIGQPKDGIYPVTIYEDGLPGRGFKEHDDDYYTGTATLAADSGTLEITLGKKFDEGREERVESALKKLTAKITEIGTAADNSKIFALTSLHIEIPANREWDAVQLQRLPDEKSPVQE